MNCDHPLIGTPFSLDVGTGTSMIQVDSDMNAGDKRQAPRQIQPRCLSHDYVRVVVASISHHDAEIMLEDAPHSPSCIKCPIFWTLSKIKERVSQLYP